ncbi:MAG: PAS domain S-box protein [Nitrospirae bacterium]|nr:PAS domain S-box protein [Nitrospirota bacterium]
MRRTGKKFKKEHHLRNARKGIFCNGTAGNTALKSMLADLPDAHGEQKKDLQPESLPFQTILNDLPAAVFVKRLDDGKFIYWNRESEKLFGLKSEDVIGKSDYDFFPKEQADFFRQKDLEAIRLKGVLNIPEEVLDSFSHGRILLRTTKVPIFGRDGEPLCLAGISEDVTELKATHDSLSRVSLNLEHLVDERTRALTEEIAYRKQIDKDLQESEARYRRLLEAVTDYIYTVTVEDGRVVKTVHGPGCVAVTGYTAEEYEANSMLWFQMVYDADRGLVIRKTDKLLSGALTEPLEHRIRHKDGSIRWVRNTAVSRFNEHGHLIGYDSLIIDITEKRKLEAALMHAQKLEAVGQMAGGIAHDFNNILTAISGYSHLMLMKMSPEHPLRNNVEQVIFAGERAATLTKSLLSFSRKDTIDPKPIRLREVIDSVHKLLARLISEDICLFLMQSEHDIIVMADSGQIGQVLINLVTNARDAMPTGGHITIMTSVEKLDKIAGGNGRHNSETPYAVITVSDTGAGIEPQIRDKIFEPFFTTKEPGKGTGLGLSLVHGIVMQHQGHISIVSEPGKGTTFRIAIPLLHSESAVCVTDAMAAASIICGTETILLVEDDAMVRNYLRECLSLHGYTVIEAADGREAVDIFKNQHHRIGLVLTDVIMPNRNGLYVHNEVKKINPDSKVLFMSGHTADVFEKAGTSEIDSKMLIKPIHPHTLLSSIREALDSTP